MSKPKKDPKAKPAKAEKLPHDLVWACHRCHAIIPNAKAQKPGVHPEFRGKGRMCPGIPEKVTREELHNRRFPPMATPGARYVVPTTTVVVVSATRARITVRDLEPVGRATWSFSKRMWLRMRPVPQ